jgi:hypothetical protein
LARKLTKGLNIDPSEGFERSNTPQEKVFPGQIHIDKPPGPKKRPINPERDWFYGQTGLD